MLARQLLGRRDALGIVDHDGETVPGETFGNGGADAARSAGDKRDLIVLSLGGRHVDAPTMELSTQCRLEHRKGGDHSTCRNSVLRADELSLSACTRQDQAPSSLHPTHPTRRSSHGIPAARRIGLQGARAQLRHRHVRRQRRASSRPGARPTSPRRAAPGRHLPRRRRHACSTPPTSTRTGMAEEILGEAIKGRRDQAADLDQGDVPTGRRARTTSARRASTCIDAVDAQPEAPRHRLHRPLPAARLRRA